MDEAAVMVRREIMLPSEPGEVWSALTEAERLEEWFASDVELDPVPGGEGIFRWGDGEERQAVVEEVDPERRLAFTWEESRVVIELEPAEDGTRLVVTETLGSGWATALELRAHALVHA